jgi:hypothetical protein
VKNIAYKLNLPQGFQVHPVFYVSQLKEKLDTNVTVVPDLLIMGRQTQLNAVPAIIFGSKNCSKEK